MKESRKGKTFLSYIYNTGDNSNNCFLIALATIFIILDRSQLLFCVSSTHDSLIIKARNFDDNNICVCIHCELEPRIRTKVITELK